MSTAVIMVMRNPNKEQNQNLLDDKRENGNVGWLAEEV
jgi:hypothetical protein